MKRILIDANYINGRGGARIYEEYSPTLPARMWKGGFYIGEYESSQLHKSGNGYDTRTDNNCKG